MAEINKISSDIGDQRQFNSPFDNSRSKKCFKLLRGTGIWCIQRDMNAGYGRLSEV